MGSSPCCATQGMKKGAWTAYEDQILIQYIKVHGACRWRSISKKSGLRRCGKSCRLRWLNYLRPDIKRGNISPDEEDLIIRLHRLLGNRWSLIAGRLPGRTDNEIKNYWNTILRKKVEKDDHKTQQKGPKENIHHNDLASSSATTMASQHLEDHSTVDDGEMHLQIGSNWVGSTGANNILNNDEQDCILDFEVGELNLSDFFKDEFSCDFINYCNNNKSDDSGN